MTFSKSHYFSMKLHRFGKMRVPVIPFVDSRIFSIRVLYFQFLQMPMKGAVAAQKRIRFAAVKAYGGEFFGRYFFN